MRARILMATGLALGLAWLVPPAVAGTPAVHEYTLDNGMTVVVREDHRAPVVVSMVWFAVGSSYEQRPLTGISHVVEHMMFKGTETRPTGEFSRLIAERGGRQNAFTGRDFTGYHQQLAVEHLPLAFELEADRMQNLVFDQGEYEREMEVVREERRQRVEDNPTAKFMERFRAVAWSASPYGQPVIGWMEDLDRLRLSEVEDWYRRWHGPESATLVVVGAVDPDAVFALAEEHFGPVPARERPEPIPGGDIPDPGERAVTVRIPAELPYLAMGWRVPTLGSIDREDEEALREVYALALLRAVLSGGQAAILPERLERQQGVAVGAGASYSATARLQDLFLLAGRPAPGAGLDELEAALREEVQRLQEEPLDEERLVRARRQYVADELFSQDSMRAQAMRLGALESTGIGWEAGERFLEGVQTVTAEDIQRVARRYLVDDQLTVGRLVPADREASTDAGEEQ
ncbi:M16 family metallopeptidase [Alkalilimnicola ehrlichii MLHE-1]|uniref:Peptidase M16 domain protein n=1 Tax=Alkalilimnicola ehrlichii (strain ATCC BAA-1101 / DSM 17681 / MLHE-1) TaxID=187272 RepID=Q0A589_ALKEH|nr:pitrilysin family protein [Alkalilimnicola ehrlichii]ABI57998.1 peptidase M16 domain protein [Alkalilimnicola ehrlichii MLHE-1]